MRPRGRLSSARADGVVLLKKCGSVVPRKYKANGSVVKGHVLEKISQGKLNNPPRHYHVRRARARPTFFVQIRSRRSGITCGGVSGCCTHIPPNGAICHLARSAYTERILWHRGRARNSRGFEQHARMATFMLAYLHTFWLAQSNCSF